MKEKIKTPYNTVYTSCGFQSNVQVQSSQAREVTVDNEVATNSRTLHTLNVSHNPGNDKAIDYSSKRQISESTDYK